MGRNNNKVYVTRRLPGPALEMLKGLGVTLHKGQEPPTKKEILKNVAGKDAILCMLSDRIDKEVMDAAGPQLKIISSYSTGFEHIDVAEATKRGIYVTYTSDILAEATADITFALLLACARNVVAGDRMVRQKKWKVGWMPDLLLGHNVHGATIGIIGLGKIGSAVARRARGFGMEILYYSRRRNEAAEKELGARYASLDDLLAHSDFVTIHTTLNDASKHLINRERLEKMKKTAFLINTARGAVVNERDLVSALKKGTIAGAGLDVFEKEPLGKSPLVAMKNVVLLPHIGSADRMTRSRMAEVAAKSILDVLAAGKEPDPKFLVNPQARR
ncbi:2-hydroxyacid dehydrogenase [Nitrososphaera viennensis]|uniref:Glyoxylate reductase n=2 Tax=Nitrososphaera viennensis TaxID=1034015 RepID=A0A060HI62_9ARCH|nr:D-glycerate dehydrogenase [Nitrososphaera viennensis]AIC14975.1 glyoxylate reductase [Nitrososphaera viennensis EN76]UVS69910.1 D-glycerate dehydrogenase [Nitrososphaera viennensis]